MIQFVYIIYILNYNGVKAEIILSSILLQDQGQGHWNFYIFGFKLEILAIFVNQFLCFSYV